MESIAVLGYEHQAVLAQLAAVEDQLANADAGAALASFLAYLQDDVLLHFSVEEHALFPMLERYFGHGGGPLAVMNAEHASFRELLSDLRAAVLAADLSQQRACAQDLIELLRVHIAKEDNILFPMAARVLNPTEQDEVDTCARAIRQQPGAQSAAVVP